MFLIPSLWNDTSAFRWRHALWNGHFARFLHLASMFVFFEGLKQVGKPISTFEISSLNDLLCQHFDRYRRLDKHPSRRECLASLECTPQQVRRRAWDCYPTMPNPSLLVCGGWKGTRCLLKRRCTALRNKHDIVFEFHRWLNTTDQWVQLKKERMALRWSSPFDSRILFAETRRLLLNLMGKIVADDYVDIEQDRLYLYSPLQPISKRSVRHSFSETP